MKNKQSVEDVLIGPNRPVTKKKSKAPVILTIKTGETPMYIGLTIGIISILGVGIYSIKKYILK